MKFVSKLLLGVGLLGLSLQPSALIAQEVNFYGTLTGNLYNTTSKTSDNDLNEPVIEDISYTDFATCDTWLGSNGNNFGINAKLSDTLSATLEMSHCGDGFRTVEGRLYHMNVNAGPIELILGTQTTLYSLVAWAPDLLFIGHGIEAGVAGPGYEFRNLGATFKIKAGSISNISVSLVRPQNPGGRDGDPDADTLKQTETPAIEGSAGLSLKDGLIGLNLAFHQEDVGYTTTATESTLQLAFNFLLDTRMVDFFAAISLGTPRFTNSVVPITSFVSFIGGDDASLDSADYIALGFWLSIQPTEILTIAGFLGSESAAYKATNAAFDELNDQTISLGFHGGLNFKGFYFFGEVTTSTREIDFGVGDSATKFEDTTLGLGAQVSWST